MPFDCRPADPQSCSYLSVGPCLCHQPQHFLLPHRKWCYCFCQFFSTPWKKTQHLKLDTFPIRSSHPRSQLGWHYRCVTIEFKDTFDQIVHRMDFAPVTQVADRGIVLQV